MKEKHIHKFKRLRYKSGNEIFFCALPDCNSKLSLPLALGKRSLCWRCGEPFIMNEYSLRLAKPHCDKCHQPKKIEEFLPSIPDVILEHVEQHRKIVMEQSLSERLNQTIQQEQTEEEEL